MPGVGVGARHAHRLATACDPAERSRLDQAERRPDTEPGNQRRDGVHLALRFRSSIRLLADRDVQVWHEQAERQLPALSVQQIGVATIGGLAVVEPAERVLFHLEALPVDHEVELGDGAQRQLDVVIAHAPAAATQLQSGVLRCRIERSRLVPRRPLQVLQRYLVG